LTVFQEGQYRHVLSLALFHPSLATMGDGASQVDLPKGLASPLIWPCQSRQILWENVSNNTTISKTNKYQIDNGLQHAETTGSTKHFGACQ